jgi:AcrR family transcriptional regulator
MDTKLKLIRTAERLFGERGIDGVSMREVLEVAGQRNASALSYHFGDRDGLLAAIGDARRVGVDARRMQLLDELLQDRDAADPAIIANAIVTPLAEVMRQDDDGANYLCFIAHMWMSNRLQFHDMIKGRHDTGLRRCLRLYLTCRSDLAPRFAREIFAVSGRNVVYALADWTRDRTGRSSGFPRSRIAEFEASLIAMTANALAAQVGRTSQTVRPDRRVPA